MYCEYSCYHIFGLALGNFVIQLVFASISTKLANILLTSPPRGHIVKSTIPQTMLFFGKLHYGIKVLSYAMDCGLVIIKFGWLDGSIYILRQQWCDDAAHWERVKWR